METNNKLREALVEIVHRLSGEDDSYLFHPMHPDDQDALDAIYELAKAALAEPVKNCEVGTAEEQEKRFHDFCRARHLPRTEDSSYCAYKCPLEGDTCCELQWAQMPYEEGGDK